MGLKTKVNIQGHESEKVSDFLLFIFASCTEKTHLGLKTPLCSAMIDCVILGVIFHKIELKS